MSTNTIHSEINNTSFEAIADNINTVLNAFNDNNMIVLFTHNTTVAMSKVLHSEAELMKRLQWCDHVRICSKQE